MSRLYYPKTVRGILVGGDGAGLDLPEAATKVAKLIPVELVTAYGAFVGAALAIRWEGARLPAFWIAFALCWVLTHGSELGLTAIERTR